jgi:phage tail tape-measure protein
VKRTVALRTRLRAELQGDVVGRVGRIDQSLADLVRANVDGLAVEAEAVAEGHATAAPSARIAGPPGNPQVTGS